MKKYFSIKRLKRSVISCDRSNWCTEKEKYYKISFYSTFQKQSNNKDPITTKEGISETLTNKREELLKLATMKEKQKNF